MFILSKVQMDCWKRSFRFYLLGLSVEYGNILVSWILSMLSSLEKCLGFIYLVRTQNVPKNCHFLPPDTHTYVRSPWVKNCQSSIIVTYLTSWMFWVLNTPLKFGVIYEFCWYNNGIRQKVGRWGRVATLETCESICFWVI